MAARRCCKNAQAGLRSPRLRLEARLQSCVTSPVFLLLQFAQEVACSLAFLGALRRSRPEGGRCPRNDAYQIIAKVTLQSSRKSSLTKAGLPWARGVSARRRGDCCRRSFPGAMNQRHQCHLQRQASGRSILR